MKPALLSSSLQKSQLKSSCLKSRQVSTHFFSHCAQVSFTFFVFFFLLKLFIRQVFKYTYKNHGTELPVIRLCKFSRCLDFKTLHLNLFLKYFYSNFLRNRRWIILKSNYFFFYNSKLHILVKWTVSWDGRGIKVVSN